MEKGILSIAKTSKGFAASIQFEKGGVTKSLPLTSWRPGDDKLNGKPCRFSRDKGQVIHLETEDGTVLFTARPSQAPVHSTGTAAGQRGVPDIFDIQKTRLPKDVRRLGITDIDNFYLKLNKAGHFEDGDDRNGQIIPRTIDKCKFVVAKTSRSAGFVNKISANYGDLKFSDIAQKQAIIAATLCNGNCVTHNLKPNWKMALGLGNESVYETSITLHHVYGFPYVPASSVKGVLRSYIICHFFDFTEEKAIKDKGFCDIFGCPEDIEKEKSYYQGAREGQAIFFDAYPLSAPEVEPDIMNPHFGDYYNSESNRVKPPVDTISPVPIHFLTVQKNTFQFIAGCSTASDVLIESNFYRGTLKDFLNEFLSKALTESGIGAKTATGYGYMQLT